MDWPRAKTLIILALCLLNLFLAYHLYLEPVLPALEPVYLTAASEAEVSAALAAYGVEAQLPASLPPRLPVWRLEPRLGVIDPATLLAGQEISEEDGGLGACVGRLYRGSDGVVCASPDGYVIYAALTRETGGRASPSQLPAAHRRVAAFLDALGGLPGDVEGPEIRYDETSGVLVFRYVQVIPEASSGTLTVFPGYIELRVTADRVVSFEQRLWNVHPSASRPEPVMPVTTLLLRHLEPGGRLHQVLAGAAAGEAERGTRTLSVRLGYALGERQQPDAAEAGEGTGAGLEFAARPAWQISLDGAGVLLFDARSGEPLADGAP